MPLAKANGIEICYETHGPAAGRPLLMIMGFGGQLVRWPPALLDAFVDRGYRVVVHDNRDVGLSTHLDHHGRPDFKAIARGQTPPPYTIDDMAADSAGLLTALDIERAHVFGVSMGGMIAQSLATRHGERVRTLTSVMSATGNPDIPPASPEVAAVITGPPPKSRQEAIDGAVRNDRTIGSQVFDFDEALCRKRAALAYDRAFNPRGVGRQLAAIVARGDRRAELAGVTAPTMVVHGSDDPLIHPDGGRDTAAAIEGAQLRIIEGMGHDLPAAVHDQLVDAVDTIAADAD